MSNYLSQKLCRSRSRRLAGCFRPAPKSFQAVKYLGIFVEESPLVPFASITNNLLNGLEPLSIGPSERTDRPVASKHHSIGAEHVHRMIDERCKVLRRPMVGSGRRQNA